MVRNTSSLKKTTLDPTYGCSLWNLRMRKLWRIVCWTGWWHYEFEKWISDQGTHFKNDVMRTIRQKLHIAHHFTHLYCPWSNGTIEVVCRELIRTSKAFLLEFSFPYDKWPVVLPLLQCALNKQKDARMGGRVANNRVHGFAKTNHPGPH